MAQKRKSFLLQSTVPVKGKLAKQINAALKGPTPKVGQRVRKVMSDAFRESMPEKGEIADGPRYRGRTLLQEIHSVLKLRCTDRNGKASTNFREAAVAFVEQMKEGAFPFHKEFLDRENGRVPATLNVNENSLKAYIGVPVDDDAGAP